MFTDLRNMMFISFCLFILFYHSPICETLRTKKVFTPEVEVSQKLAKKDGKKEYFV